MGRIAGSKVVDGKVISPQVAGIPKASMINVIEIEIKSLEGRLEHLRAAKKSLNGVWGTNS